jgi:two-component system sensor histidine kinase TrcS
VLYQVLQPVSGGDGALLLYYDVSELLERRQRTQGTQPATKQLIGLAASFTVVAWLLLIGRARAVRHFRKVMVETEYLRRHSAELEQHNRELDAARAEAERALALAEETNRIRAEFVLMINHELRTPLTSVVTGAELIQSDLELSPMDRQQIVDDMVTDGRRLQEMITQMLAVARIENRGLDYTLRDVPVADVRHEIEKKHPKAWRHDTPPHLDPYGAYVRTDPGTLSQLIASLTDNAFTHGATHVELAHTNRVPFTPMMEFGNRPQRAVCFLVRDNGPGIDLDFLPRAFDKFEKHGPSPGTGLGLYVARIVVEALQGSLAVETSPAGTTMAVAVPLVGVVAPSVAK